MAKLFSLGGLVLCACTRREPPRAAVVPTPIDAARPQDAATVGTGPPTLPFTIAEVYEAQHPTTMSPWHAPGGAWTFFDAQTKRGARFTFGVALRSPSQPGTFEGTLASEDAASLAADIATELGVPAPAKSTHAKTSARVELVAVRDGVSCRPGYGCGEKGTWTATTLLLAGGQVEVFFNWDLVGRRGELSQLDSVYDRALVDALAGL